VEFRWNEWNEEHLARHGVVPEEAEEVIRGTRHPFPLVHGDERYFVWALHPAGGFFRRYSSSIRMTRSL
jgi:hypothetical protein